MQVDGTLDSHVVSATDKHGFHVGMTVPAELRTDDLVLSWLWRDELDRHGLATLRHNDMLTVLHPFLEELSNTVNETVHLIVLDGSNCRFVDSVESGHALRTTARIGVEYPAYLTSGGKALLAELSDDELRRLYPRRLPQLTERSPASRDQLMQELERVRADGYATNFGESEVGIRAVAAIQHTSGGRPTAAVAVSAPEQRLPETRIPELVEALKDITARARPRLP